MSARNWTNLFRHLALLTIAAVATISAAPARAALYESLLGFAGMKDQLSARSNIVLCGGDCPTCPSYGGGESSGEGDQPEMMGDAMASDQGGQSLERAGTGSEQFAGLGGDTMSVNDAVGGYIDNPVVANWFRARYDVAVNNPHPDLAEFFYAKYALAGGPGVDTPTGRSPTNVNYQVGSFYLELLLAPRWSFFAELAIQRTDIFFPDGQGDFVLVKNGGLGDTIAGMKYAIYADEYSYLTAQLKVYAPTGDASRGLGTRHASIEPGLLYLRRLGPRAYYQGELRYWIPVGGTDYAGNVLRSGGGIGYDIIGSNGNSGPFNPYTSMNGMRVTAVTEIVGWTVFNGRFTPGDEVAAPIQSLPVPDGFTVVNVKPGFRFTKCCTSLYAGAGIAITGDRWYSDLFRVEYRRTF